VDSTRSRPDRGHVIGEGVAWVSTWSLRILLVALGVILFGLLIGELWSIAFPVFLGLIIATVFEPPVTWLRAHGWPSLLATIVVFVVFLAVIAGIVTALVPTVASQAPEIAQAAGAGVEQVQRWLGGPPFNLGQTQIGMAVQTATDRLQQNATTIAGGVVTGVTAVAGGLVDLVLALVLAFLFVKDGTRFLPWLTSVVGRRAGGHLEQVGRRCWRRLGGFIRSQAIIGAADAVFIGVGLALFGVPLALPLAVLTFFGAFIPIVGSLVAGILSVLIALVVKGPTVALFVLILILVVQQVEGNLLQPIVQGKGLGLHAAVVILAVTAGSSLAGIAGAFLSVPIAAVGAEIVRYLGEQIDERTGDEPPAERAERARREHDESATLGDPSPEDGSPTHGGAADGAPAARVPGDGRSTGDGTSSPSAR
jgi:predicted PurR-regulated permease PerM